MKLLCLYNGACALPLFAELEKQGHEIVLWSERLTHTWCIQQNFDLTISYTYRYILKKDVLQALGNNVVNLHNSFLPWNRGASPNLWSIIENTPTGVSLHFISEELDKGDIISQCIVPLEDEDTLQEAYNKLDRAAQQQFLKAFKFYPYWESLRKKATGEGSYHTVADTKPYLALVPSWDISIKKFKNAVCNMKI